MASFEKDLETILQLVIDVELEPERDERRALLRIAHHVDKRLNRQTLSNKLRDEHYETPSRLALELGCTDPKCRICTRAPDRSLPN